LEEINADLPEADFLGVEAPFDDHSTLADFRVLIGRISSPRDSDQWEL